VLLLGLGYLASARGARKDAWRLLETSAMIQFFGLFTFQSLIHRDVAFYPVVVIATAVVVLILARMTERFVLLVGAGVTLLINGWIQYFMRLSDVLPSSVLLVGFGAGLLLIGVLYEQMLKKRLPELREWS
jgi:hypothetical protein